MEANSQFAEGDVIESIIGEYKYMNATEMNELDGYIKDDGNEESQMVLYWENEEWIIAELITNEANVITRELTTDVTDIIASCATHFIHYSASECDPYTINMEIANLTNAHEITVTEGSCASDEEVKSTASNEEVNEEVKSCWEYPSYDDCW
eukprot:967648_1